MMLFVKEGKKTERKQPQTAKNGKNIGKFFRRYWYWFVVLPILATVVVVWMYFLGIFEKTEPVVLYSTSPETIYLNVDSTYLFNVSASDGSTVTYVSSNTKVAEIDENGLILTHIDGSATITAKAGSKTHKVIVSVSRYAVTWFLTVGDSFTPDEIKEAFPELEATYNGFYLSKEDVIEDISDEDGERYKIIGIGQENSRINENYGLSTVFIYAGTSEEINAEKGILQIYLFEDGDLCEAEKKKYEENHPTKEKTVPKFDENKIDKEEEAFPYEEIFIRPSFNKDGAISYAYELAPDGDTHAVVVLTNDGKIVCSAKNSIYVTAYIEGTDEVYRVHINIVPSSFSRQMQLYETIEREELEGFITFENETMVVSDAGRLNIEYDAEGNPERVMAVYPTEKEKAVYLRSLDSNGGIIFEMTIYIKDGEE